VKAIVVDDCKAMRAILKRVLHECGIDDVIEATSAPAALDVLHALDSTEPAIALVDSDLPADSEIDVVDAVRAEAATRDLRVVTIGATSTDPDVVKPFTTTVLREHVRASIAAA
jgi:CheY-like chemotaxis protein